MLTGLGVSAEQVERAQLLVSELAANVVRHTTSDQFAVRLQIEPGPESWLEVGVHDEDSIALPESRRYPQPLDMSGRGLKVITELADAWGVEPTATGKWVRVLIDENVLEPKQPKQPKQPTQHQPSAGRRTS